jgi:hypothetical protein
MFNLRGPQGQNARTTCGPRTTVWETLSYTMLQIGWGALNLNSTNYPDHGHHGYPPLSKKISLYMLLLPRGHTSKSWEHWQKQNSVINWGALTQYNSVATLVRPSCPVSGVSHSRSVTDTPWQCQCRAVCWAQPTDWTTEQSWLSLLQTEHDSF